MKKVICTMLALALLFTACSTGAQQAVTSSGEDLAAQFQELTASYNSLKADYKKLESEYDALQEEHSKLKADYTILEVQSKPREPDTAPQENESATPASEVEQEQTWEDFIPDGLDVSVELFDDFTLLVRCINNTGDSISLTTSYDFADDNQEEIMWGSSNAGYIGAGSEHVFICDCPDPIGYYALQFDIGRVYQKIQEANEALSMESVRNDDNSVTATFYTSAEDGTSVSGYIFYLDNAGKILGYAYCGLGFSYEMSNDFDAPDFDYADYIICYEAIA